MGQLRSGAASIGRPWYLRGLCLMPSVGGHKGKCTGGCSDEIYGGSIFKRGEEMVSAAQVVEELSEAEQAAAAPYVHILYGLSKDW